jgi:hypothetical protein
MTAGVSAHRRTLGALLAVVALSTGGGAHAQERDRVAAARALYAQAAYDEALAALGSSGGVDAHQYRALCFMALGRQQEAEASLAAVIEAAPAYQPSDTEFPPRLVQLFAATRARVLPAVVRRLFAEGRRHFRARSLERARASFSQVLAVSADPSIAVLGDIPDLRLLSAGYLDMIAGNVILRTADPLIATP